MTNCVKWATIQVNAAARRHKNGKDMALAMSFSFWLIPSPRYLPKKPLLNWNVCGSQGAVGSRLSSRDGSCRLGRQRLGGPNHSVRVGAVIGRAGALPGNRTRAHGVVAEGGSSGRACHEVVVATLSAFGEHIVNQTCPGTVALCAGTEKEQRIGVPQSRIVGRICHFRCVDGANSAGCSRVVRRHLRP